MTTTEPTTMTTAGNTTTTAAVPPPIKLAPSAYRKTAGEAFAKGAQNAKGFWEFAKWRLYALLVRFINYPRGYTNGRQVTIRMDAPFDVYAHEYAHALGLDHPPLSDASRWFDVRAAHPLRWTDRDGLRPRARAWLDGGDRP